MFSKLTISQKLLLALLLVALPPLIGLGFSIYWLANQNDRLSIFLIFIAVATFFLIILFSWLINRQYLSSIRKINKGLRKIQEGEITNLEQLPDLGNQDEFGELEHGYNQFVELLKSETLKDEALRISEERLNLVIQAANDGIWDWDLRENKCYYSSRWRHILGYTEESVRNTISEWFSRVHPDDIDELKADINAHLEGQTDQFSNEHRVRHADGTYIWVLTRGLAISEEGKKAHRFAGSITDINDRKKYESRLLHDAMHDPLTGMPNKSYFLQLLENALSRTNRREDYHAAVLFLNLDRFKLINDQYGHRFGNQVLIETTQRLRRSLRTMDTVARIDSDEFLILLEEINGLQDAINIAKRIYQELILPFNIKGKEVTCTASIGIVLISRGYQDATDILRDAETAMYQAKANGRNRFEIFDREMHAYTMSKIRLENELKQAMKAKQFRVLYLPILDANTGGIRFAETLLRWQHPEKGLISCESILSMVEDSETAYLLNKWVLQTACNDANKWLEAGYSELSVSVNISSKFLLNPDLVDLVQTILADNHLPGENLQLEIIESSSLYGSSVALQNLFELNAIGVQICLDAFGTVPSSLEQLKRLPIKNIKIAESFIKDLPNNQEDVAICDAIIAMAHILGMKTIGSGIENKIQSAHLKDHNCDYLQGIYFTRPLTNADLNNLLEETGTQISPLIL